MNGIKTNIIDINMNTNMNIDINIDLNINRNAKMKKITLNVKMKKAQRMKTTRSGNDDDIVGAVAVKDIFPWDNFSCPIHSALEVSCHHHYQVIVIGATFESEWAKACLRCHVVPSVRDDWFPEQAATTDWSLEYWGCDVRGCCRFQRTLWGLKESLIADYRVEGL